MCVICLLQRYIGTKTAEGLCIIFVLLTTKVKSCLLFTGWSWGVLTFSFEAWDLMIHSLIQCRWYKQKIHCLWHDHRESSYRKTDHVAVFLIQHHRLSDWKPNLSHFKFNKIQWIAWFANIANQHKYCLRLCLLSSLSCLQKMLRPTARF